jgi:hypothetical protein
LQAADDALESAAEAGTATSKKASTAFAVASAALVAFEKDFPSKCPVPDQNRGGIVISMMTVAEEEDKLGPPRVIFYALKEKLHGQVRLVLVALPLNALMTVDFQLTDNESAEPTRVIEFLLLESLPPDDKSVVVRRELSSDCSTFLLVSDSVGRDAQ